MVQNFLIKFKNWIKILAKYFGKTKLANFKENKYFFPNYSKFAKIINFIQNLVESDIKSDTKIDILKII